MVAEVPELSPEVEVFERHLLLDLEEEAAV